VSYSDDEYVALSAELIVALEYAKCCIEDVKELGQ
jgi:hypothetical protein